MDSLKIRNCVNGIMEIAVPISRTDIVTTGHVCQAIETEIFAKKKDANIFERIASC